MISKENIICFSTIDWDFIWQSQQEMMSAMANNGNRVLFIDNTGLRALSFKDFNRIKSRILNWRKGIGGIRKESLNLYIYSPIIFPFPYSRVFRFINKMLIMKVIKRWMHLMNFSNPIIWVYLPTGLVVDLTRDLDSKIIIYYSVDEFGKVCPQAKRIKKSEDVLVKESDLVFTTSLKRLDKFRMKNKNAYFFPDGLTEALLDETEKPHVIPDELKNIRRPILGYVGGVHKWVDQELCLYIAKQRPELSIVMVGPVQCDISRLSACANIYFLGRKDHRDIANYIKSFDVCLIPYKVTEYTNNSYPNKAIEYLAFGKPVVSTELEEFKNLFAKEVYFAVNHEKFLENIDNALKEDGNNLRQNRMRLARDNSWVSRIREMDDVIQNTISIKLSERESHWKEILYSFRRQITKKLGKFLLPALLVYFMVFYTPVIWFLAKPLKLSDYPAKADAIVVFAGGTGESGRPEQGYEERVQYAVNLYKQGLAGHIIFSSGYIYVFNEPLVMKALAISLGVPENAIILEDNARNTYENVKFSNDILYKNNWNKIILVSSPYHMLRVSLVFNKADRNIKVLYSPIPDSLFYSHPIKDTHGRRTWKQVDAYQIRAILHEYLGILYYWSKGQV